jgi:N-acetylglucosamine-6-phosphate deacetylase
VSQTILRGRLVLDDSVAPGRVVVKDEHIAAIELADGSGADAGGPYIAPGFVDIHVHGWGGHEAMGDTAALDGMARRLLRRGVTGFLPTAVTAPLDDLVAFADRVRAWRPAAPADGAEPLGFNLEGPFLADARRGAHDEHALRAPADAPPATLERLVEGLRVVTVAPELPGAMELIAWLAKRGIVASVGHSSATYEQARAAFEGGARSTTHLFNAMTGIDHRAPGVALAALLDDAAYTELIADGIHVAPAVWQLIARLKPADRLLLVSDAVAMAGTSARRGRIGALDCEIDDGRVVLAGTTTLAGSAIALDDAVRNLVREGFALPAAVAAASRNPLTLLGIEDRGRIAVGQRADLVELTASLQVHGVMRAGQWIAAD